MQNDSPVKGLIGRLAASSLGVGSTIFGFNGLGKMNKVFSRENVVNMLLPAVLSGGVNSVLDKFGSPKVVAKKPNNQNVNPASETDDPDSEEDLYEELLETMDDGFSETNENLVKILKALGGENNDAVLVQKEESAAQLSLFEEQNDTLAELVAVNGQMVKSLEGIEKNTKVDELAEREKELESKNATVLSATQSAAAVASLKGPDTKDEKSEGFLSKILGGLGDAAMGYVGLKTAKGAISTGAKTGIFQRAKDGLKGALKRSGPLKILGIGAGLGGLSGVATAAPSAPKIPSLTPPVSPIVEAESLAAKTAASVAPKAGSSILSGVKTVGGKLLGAPLAVASGALETYDVATNKDLSVDQKTEEISKIGGKTVGALAGAQAGATIGAVAGPVGIAIGGLLGGIGGFFLGEKGGEVVGKMINTLMPSKETPVDNVASDTAKLQTITTPSQNTTNLQAAAKIEQLVKPDIGTLTTGQTKQIQLQTISKIIDKNAIEKEGIRNTQIVVPVSVTNNNGGPQQQQNTPYVPLSVPAPRNQDGTIQRLLDANYKPLMN